MSETKRYFINPIPDEGGALDELPNVIYLDETPGITCYAYVRERTCTMRYYPASNLWRCSACVGATHAERTLDEPPVYCQWCGARVIQYE